MMTMGGPEPRSTTWSFSPLTSTSSPSRRSRSRKARRSVNPASRSRRFHRAGEIINRRARRRDELGGVVAQLKEETRALRQRQATLWAERATLMQKNEQVRARVEAMIGRLKAMESGA